jgi:hypothetical protein
VGAAGAAGYTVGTLGAEQIDKHTGWFDRAVVQGHEASDALKDMGLNEDVADVAGAVVTGVQSANVHRLVLDPLSDLLSD